VDTDGHAEIDCGGLPACNLNGQALKPGECGFAAGGGGACRKITPMEFYLQKAANGLDWANEYLGFAKSDCSGGGLDDCIDALGMAGTAVIAAVESGGASEEEALARSETKIGNLAKGLAKEGTLEAAEREVNGGMKVIREDGKLFEHAENYVRQHIGGLDRQANHLERFIKEHPGLSDSQKQRAISAIRFARDTAAAARTIITPKDPI
jgi:hypothetical protein